MLRHEQRASLGDVPLTTPTVPTSIPITVTTVPGPEPTLWARVSSGMLNGLGFTLGTLVAGMVVLVASKTPHVGHVIAKAKEAKP